MTIHNITGQDITRGLEAARDALGNTDTLKLLQEFIDLPDPNVCFPKAFVVFPLCI
jgi:hypothetical protein